MQHPGPTLGMKFLFYREFVKLRKEGNAWSSDILATSSATLRRQAYSLYFVTGGFEFGLPLFATRLGHQQFALGTFARSSLTKSRDCPHLRVGRRGRSGAGLGGPLHQNNQDNGEDNLLHYGPP